MLFHNVTGNWCISPITDVPEVAPNSTSQLSLDISNIIPLGTTCIFSFCPDYHFDIKKNTLINNTIQWSMVGFTYFQSMVDTQNHAIIFFTV